MQKILETDFFEILLCEEKKQSSYIAPSTEKIGTLKTVGF